MSKPTTPIEQIMDELDMGKYNPETGLWDTGGLDTRFQTNERRIFELIPTANEAKGKSDYIYNALFDEDTGWIPMLSELLLYTQCIRRIYEVNEKLSTNKNGWIIFPEGQTVLSGDIGDYTSLIISRMGNMSITRHYFYEDQTDMSYNELQPLTEYEVHYIYMEEEAYG